MPYVTQKLYINTASKLYLTDTAITAEQASASVTLVTEMGTVATNSLDAVIQNVACTWDAVESKYYVELTLKSTMKAGYYRCFWKVLDTGGSIVALNANNNPEIIQALSLVSSEIEIVPVQWWYDAFLNLVPLGNYPAQAIRESIQASIGELENETDLLFYKRLIENERHDYFLEDVSRTYWMQQMFKAPLQSVYSLRALYGTQEIVTFESDYLIADQNMNTIEILPSQNGYFFTTLFNGINTVGSISLRERIPLFFDISYYAGFDWDVISEQLKNEIRFAVGRRAAINIFAKLDSAMGYSAKSKSMDGVSESVSYTASAMYGQYSAQIEQFKKDDEAWIKAFRKKYNRDMFITIS